MLDPNGFSGPDLVEDGKPHPYHVMKSRFLADLPYYSGEDSVAGFFVYNETYRVETPVSYLNLANWKLEYNRYPTGHLVEHKPRRSHKWLMGETTSGTRVMNARIFVSWLRSWTD